jgi:hypothetical protein
MKRGLLFCCVMAMMAGAAHSAQSKVRGIAGTYDLLICKGECSFSERSNVVRTAVVVIFDHEMRREEVERIDATYLNFRYDKAKACYMLAYPNRQTSGVTSWTLDGKTLSFSLMHSPDSWYSVRVERTGDMLRGTGNFWTAGVAPPPGYAPDRILGKRRGPADISICKAGAH